MGVMTCKTHDSAQPSTFWQQFLGVYRFALLANLEMQTHLVGTRITDFGNFLPRLNDITCLDQHFAAVRITANEAIAVINIH